MKKLLALLTALLFVAPLAKAADLWVQNRTDKDIKVTVKGPHGFIGPKTIATGKWKKFFVFGRMYGPLKFSFVDNEEGKTYTTYTKNDFEELLRHLIEKGVSSGFNRLIYENIEKGNLKRAVLQLYARSHQNRREISEFQKHKWLPVFPLLSLEVKGTQITINEKKKGKLISPEHYEGELIIRRSWPKKRRFIFGQNPWKSFKEERQPPFGGIPMAL